jgi:basic amino acid/polyamine antiporter, APA family
VPLPSLVGGVLTLALWVASLFTHGGAAVAGPAWLAAGAVVYLLSRRAGGASLLGRATPPVPDLVAGDAGGAQRILVPMKLADVGEEVLATALRLAEERGATVRVLHVVKVPMALPLDHVPGEEEERAREAIDEARELAAELGVEVIPRVMRARSLSEAIIDEAEASGTDLIVMGSASRWRGQRRFFSPTVDEVLRRARCEVMVVTYPPGVLEDEDAS